MESISLHLVCMIETSEAILILLQLSESHAKWFEIGRHCLDIDRLDALRTLFVMFSCAVKYRCI